MIGIFLRNPVPNPLRSLAASSTYSFCVARRHREQRFRFSKFLLASRGIFRTL